MKEQGTEMRDLVAEARELLSKVTPWPWVRTLVQTTIDGRQFIEIEHRNPDCVSDMIVQVDSGYLCAEGLNETDQANAALIARAPELLASLCDEVERLKTERDDLRSQVEQQNYMGMFTDSNVGDD